MFQLVSTIIAVILVAVDQIVKNWAAETLVKGDIAIIENVLYLNEEKLNTVDAKHELMYAVITMISAYEHGFGIGEKEKCEKFCEIDRCDGCVCKEFAE